LKLVNKYHNCFVRVSYIESRMVGKVTSRGDRIMRAQIARRLFQLDGRGITIGVISDSFNALKQADKDILSGDLPGRRNPLGNRKPVRVLQDLRGGNDEGRAMLQIISDIAPGAELLHHTAFTPKGRVTEKSFAKAVKALARAGADIIVDDIGFATPFFQDGLAAQTVTQTVDQGIAYFSAIGNDSNRAYRSQFRPTGTPDGTFIYDNKTYEMHDFDPGEGVDFFQDVGLKAGSLIAPSLGWDEPSGQIKNDMELFLVSSPAAPTVKVNLLATSVTLISAGVEQPLEELVYESRQSQTAYLIVARKVDPATSPTQIQWISTANGADSNVSYQYVDTSGNNDVSTIYGQPNARGAVAVGAVEARQPPGVKLPVLDSFSSRGGTPILIDAQGQRLRQSEIRQKPEIVAPNGVATTFDPSTSFNPFFGTSAAAPHAAAVAALLLQRAGGSKRLTPAQITQLMQQTAIPLDPPGNFRSGAGLVQADDAVLAAAQTRLTGTEGRDFIQGRTTADNLYGLGGGDRLRGGRGFDALLGGNSADRLWGNAGHDYLLGEAGRDWLWGGQGHDTLLGNQGRDRLEGGRGNDLLAGGGGRNELRGGQGRNLFVLSKAGMAQIRDFQTQRDRIGLDDRLQFGQLRQIERGNNLLIQWRGQQLAKLSGVTELLNQDAFTQLALRD
jgi:subtilisin family serine protease